MIELRINDLFIEAGNYCPNCGAKMGKGGDDAE